MGHLPNLNKVLLIIEVDKLSITFKKSKDWFEIVSMTKTIVDV